MHTLQLKLLGLIVLLLLPKAWGEELVLGHFVSTNHPMHRDVFLPLAATLSKVSGGRLTLRIEPNLKDSSAQYDRVVSGAYDLVFGLPDYTPGRFPRTMLMELPEIAGSPREGTQMLAASLPRSLEPEFKEVHPLGVWVNEPSVLLTRNRQVTRPEDLVGVRVRASDPTSARILGLLGAVPVILPVNGIAAAFNSGDIEAALIGSSGILPFQLHTVANGCTEGLPSLLTGFYLLMNRPKWDALDEESKRWLTEATGAAFSRDATRAYERSGQEGLDAMGKGGTGRVRLSPAEFQRFLDRITPVIPEVLANLSAGGIDGQAVLDDFRPRLRVGSLAPTPTLEIRGAPGTRYRVEGSMDLQEWHPLGETRTGANGGTNWVPGGTTVTNRYFRTAEIPVANPNLRSIDHLVVLYMENRSFDSLYGFFPGANGIANAPSFVQVDLNGVPYQTLPAGNSGIQTNLPVAPFDAGPFFPVDKPTQLSITHQFYEQQAQIHGGRMDRFVVYGSFAAKSAPIPQMPIPDGIVMGYHDATQLPLGQLAMEYTLCDNFFHSAFGGSFLNHQWLVAARSPVFRPRPSDPPPLDSMKAILDRNGTIIGNWSAILTPDEYAVNTCSSSQLAKPGVGFTGIIPPQVHDTIGDRLDERGIDWAWYSEDWDAVLKGLATGEVPDQLNFHFHHQPFAFFEQYAPNSDAGKAHLMDLNRFEEDLAAKRPLKTVSFLKFGGRSDEHPGYTSVLGSEQKAHDLIRRIQSHPDYARSLIVVTYDENGGHWDHVAPPVVDRWGPGVRVPAILISPFVRRGYVDHEQYETVSILRMIEERFDLRPLGYRDAAATSLGTGLVSPRP